MVSTFVTPEGLSRYHLGRIDVSSDSFRLERFLTSMNSMRSFPWASVRIFIRLDQPFEPYWDSVLARLDEYFPEAEIQPFRLELPSQWRQAFAEFPPEDLILLNTNDDHAMVPDSGGPLLKLASELARRDDTPLGLVTHFPEASGQLARERLRSASRLFSNIHPRGIQVRSSIGTVLVKSQFLKSWFKPGAFLAREVVIRPDNPFGRSVEFDPVTAVVPELEIFRHLDGYSHAGLYRPIPPVRNSVKFDESHTPLPKLEWSLGLWPKQLFTYSGRGADFYQTNAQVGGLLAEVASVVSRCKLHWGLRLDPFSIGVLKSSPTRVSNSSVVIGALIFFFTPVGLQNLLDVALDGPMLLAGLLLDRCFKGSSFTKKVWYFGTTRTILMLLRKKNLSGQSKAHRWL